VNTPLDSILSRGGEATPSAETTTPETQPTPAADAQAQPQIDGEAEPETHQLPDGRKTVPIEALHAERSKAKRYTEQVASFEKRLDETNAAWERRMTQLLERITPPQQPAQAPDWFDDPAKATEHALQPHLSQFESRLQAIAKDAAVSRFTEAEVDEAERAFIGAMQAQRLDTADYQKVVGSPNRYAAAVQWHKRQQAQAEIGDDPAAYRAKVEAEIREKLLAEFNGGDAPQAQHRPQAQTLPSNFAAARNVGVRNGPTWSGPTTIADIFNRKRGTG
jgi:hypothetical protein